MTIPSTLASRMFRLLAGVGLAGVVVIGCSSSSGGSASDGGADGPIFRRLSDAATDDGGGATGFDGTSGKPCTTDADCKGRDGGPGFNACSNDAVGLNPGFEATPVCIETPPGSGTDCDPTTTLFCDGPDAPSSPGMCLALTNPPAPNQGLCVPKCTFAVDGSPPVGCVGKDKCSPIVFNLDTHNNVIGVGFCHSFCETDADCSGAGTGLACQTDTGDCVPAQNKVTRTKHLGDVCTVSATTGTTTACNCATGASTAGYCTTACLVGGTPCPNGWVCDNGTPSVLMFQGSPTLIPVTMQNPSTVGNCFAPCGTADGGTVPPAEAGAPVDGGAACPGTTTCQSMTVAGLECLP
jgi:hypothetical protein